MLPLDYATKKSYKILIYRSTIKYGKILKIEIPPLPENYKVITYKDLPGRNFIKLEEYKIPVLAKDKVHYIGEPILLLVGPKIAELKLLYKQINVIYENIEISEPEIFYTKSVNIGTSEVVKDVIENYKSLTGYINTPSWNIDSKFPHGSFSKRDSDMLTNYVSTIWTSKLTENIQAITEYDEKKINIVSPVITGEYEHSLLENFTSAIFTSLAANILKKNVLFAPTSEDHFLYSSQIYGLSFLWKINFNDSNIIQNIEINIKMDCGAYPIFVEEKALRIIHGITSFYKHRNIKITVTAYRSFNPPSGISEDLYQSDALFFSEILNNKIIAESGADQLKWRLDNLLKKGYKNSSNSVIRREIPLYDMLKNIGILSDFSRKNSSIKLSNNRKSSIIHHSIKRGIGISVGYSGNNNISNKKDFSSSSITIQLEKNNKVDVYGNFLISNLEIYNEWMSVIISILDVKEDDITFFSTNEYNTPNFESKNINIITPLIKQCCEDIKSRRFKDPLPLKSIKSVRRKPGNVWDPEKWKGSPYKTSSFAACAVEVEIDKRKLIPIIKEIWLEVEVGKILNKNSILKTLNRDINRTIKWLMESKPHMENGKWDRNDFYNRTFIYAKPVIHIYINESIKGKTSAKGIGTLVRNTLPSAFIQGVSQALSAKINSFPVSRDKICMELKKDEV